jgi:hypothetical protein
VSLDERQCRIARIVAQESHLGFVPLAQRTTLIPIAHGLKKMEIAWPLYCIAK